MKTIQPRRLGHVNLFVGDLEQSMKFYEDIAGFHEIFREPDITAGFLSNGNTHHDLGLIEASLTDRVGKDGKVLISASVRGSKPGLNHLGFEMESERALVDAYDALKSADIPILRTVDHGLAHSMYMQDPDGNTIEFYADTVHDWRRFWKDNLGKTVTQGWSPDGDKASDEKFYPATYEATISSKASFKSRRVYAASLWTKNLQKMEEFYRNVVGLEESSRSEDGRTITLGTAIEPNCISLVVCNEIPKYSLAGMSIELDSMSDASRTTVSDPDGFLVHFDRPRVTSA